MVKINKKMRISELLTLDENIAGILMREGMHCTSCSSALMETLEQAAAVHGYSEEELDDLVDRLNEFLSIIYDYAN